MCKIGAFLLYSAVLAAACGGGKQPTRAADAAVDAPDAPMSPEEDLPGRGGAGSGGAAAGGAGEGGSAGGGGAPAKDAARDPGAMDAPSVGGMPGSGGGTSPGTDLGGGGTPGSGGSSTHPSGECPSPSGAAVTLDRSGGGYTVGNGLVTITLDGKGNLTQLRKGAQDLMRAGDTLYVSESGGSSYYSIGATASSVVQQSSDVVELSFVDTAGGSHDMDWDLHYVVRRGVSGFYYFLIARAGTATHPQPATLSELRTVQRFNPSLLSNGYSGERHGQLPTAAQNATFSSSTEIQDATYPLTVAPTSLPGVPSLPGFTGQHFDDGPVFSKYDWSSYRTEDRVHGLYGGGYGAWLVSPSWEFYTGGPVKQELMVHHENLILNMYHGGHFGSATTTPSPSNWAKLYGPNLVYVNAGTDVQVIADAQARGDADVAQWPYCWMKNDLYPLAGERATVTGKLVEAHGRSVAGALVTLAGPGPLIDQGYDYMFWGQADDAGAFTIPAVRPGTYALHVFATRGTIVNDSSDGEIAKTVTVAAGTNDLGTVTWAPPYHAKLIWAIGTSDQRSGEFRFDPNKPAASDNTAAHTGRMYGPDDSHGVWTVPPAATTYTVGTSSPETDWYFAQSADGTWTVKFELAEIPAAGAFLTVGLAGAARTPNLAIAVNGKSVANQTFGNDQSLYRSALQGGRFTSLTAAVPASVLLAGGNTATFTLNTKGAEGAGVFYDIVKLESD
jgi:rhamnogalacturonan endolyase